MTVPAITALGFGGCGDDGSSTGTDTSSASSGSGAGSTGGGGGGTTITVSCDPPSGTIPPLSYQTVADDDDGLQAPALAIAAPGDLDRLFIVDLSGRVFILQNGVVNADPFLDISGDIAFGGEQGLLGFAFHPDYATNGRFFVHFSQPNGDTEIAEYARGADADHASPDKVRTILTEPQPFGNHNGGSIEFGPDGLLYIFLGDGGSGGDPMGNGQNPMTRLGKILRLDVDAAMPFAPAGGYPGALPEVWAMGMRNPWRAQFDPCTGDLYIGDVGQNAWEEIDVVSPTATGLNFGWNTAEGNHCYGGAGCDLSPFEPAIHEYPHVPGEFDGGASVNGGFVYRGSEIPSLRGRYFFSDYVRGEVFSFLYQNGQATDVREHTTELGVSGMIGFGQDADGEVYILGVPAVYKIVVD